MEENAYKVEPEEWIHSFSFTGRVRMYRYDTTDDHALSTVWQEQNRRLSELICQARCGSVPAFEELYGATAPWLLRQIRRLVADGQAEDVLAELFIQVWRTLDHFDGARAVPVVWLSMMARSRALDHLRREKRHGASVHELEDGNVDMNLTSDGPEQLLSRAQQRQLVQLTLSGAQLSVQERLVVGLAYFQDSTRQEISMLTGLSPGTVRAVLMRAHGKLRNQFDPPRTPPVRDPPGASL